MPHVAPVTRDAPSVAGGSVAQKVVLSPEERQMAHMSLVAGMMHFFGTDPFAKTPHEDKTVKAIVDAVRFINDTTRSDAFRRLVTEALDAYDKKKKKAKD